MTYRTIGHAPTSFKRVTELARNHRLRRQFGASRQARTIAEAQVDLNRVRDARHQNLANALNDPCYESYRVRHKKFDFLFYWLRPNAVQLPAGLLVRYLTTTPQGASKFALILLKKRNDGHPPKKQRALSRRTRRSVPSRPWAIEGVFAVELQSGV